MIQSSKIARINTTLKRAFAAAQKGELPVTTKDISNWARRGAPPEITDTNEAQKVRENSLQVLRTLLQVFVPDGISLIDVAAFQNQEIARLEEENAALTTRLEKQTLELIKMRERVQTILEKLKDKLGGSNDKPTQ
ncbi:MAG: hypothetical protein ABIH69_07260 [bacterium]